ncbi:P-type conjugative transfer protein TrbG [Phenylobacterium sp.]|uniref:P-type conjugative transfer protein TrbG n=1 Tax=Phenylobacterium sp. TaxID=1871053 RepID=UPI0028990FCC|nr:P-type conjugative transfer protein TrbG [Phenylobacterium sp.]
MRPQTILLAMMAPTAAAAAPLAELGRANEIARVEPRRDAFANAVQVFSYSEGALFQIYAAPGQVTDLALQPGERLVGEGALAAGDTVRWVIGETHSGAGADERSHILLKPVAAGLSTNLVINTDRRTYHLELRSTRGPYLAVVRWRYPLEEARAAQLARAADAERRQALAVASGPPPALNFAYRILGRASWRPVRVYDDGRQTFIEFSADIARDDLPPLFLKGVSGELELTNYRVQGARIIVDRLFAEAELRLRHGRGATVVRLLRSGGGA